MCGSCRDSGEPPVPLDTPGPAGGESDPTEEPPPVMPVTSSLANVEEENEEEENEEGEEEEEEEERAAKVSAWDALARASAKRCVA